MKDINLQFLHVPLRGGLGNMLFQVAATLDWVGKDALSRRAILYSEDASFSSYISPLLNENRNIVLKQQLHLPYLAQKLIGGRLRFMRLFNCKLFAFAARLIDTMISNLIIIDGKHCKIFIPDNLGYQTFPKTSNNILAIGYFQTWIFSSELVDYIQRSHGIEKVSGNSNARKAIQPNQERLIVHFRLGDYLTERKFGVLSWDYYRRCIELAFENVNYKEVWIFSNDIDLSRKLYENSISDLIKSITREDFRVLIKWFGKREFSDFESFELMRHGEGYVLANSSFSWWAALSSIEKKSIVFCPEPWFKSIPEPNFLIPKSWVRIPAHFCREKSV